MAFATVTVPRAETSAPAMGPPRSSLTTPVMLPRTLRTDWYWTDWAMAAGAPTAPIAQTTRLPVSTRLRRFMLPPVLPSCLLETCARFPDSTVESGSDCNPDHDPTVKNTSREIDFP